MSIYMKYKAYLKVYYCLIGTALELSRPHHRPLQDLDLGAEFTWSNYEIKSCATGTYDGR